MPSLPVTKTYKLYLNGAFPRSESGRTDPVRDAAGKVVALASRGSRKDLRDAVTAARKAQPGWAGATGYLRGQILYRMAEMLQARAAEFAALPGCSAPEASAAVARVVAFAGWADKFPQVLGSQNGVAGPFWNVTVPGPVGVVGVVCPAEHPLLALLTLLAPVLATGSTAVVISPASPAVVCTLGEVFATADLPAGVVNLLPGPLVELLPVLSKHRDVDAILGADAPEPLVVAAGEAAADNLKRMCWRNGVDWMDAEACSSPEWLAPLVEFKTVWHPVGA